MPLEAQLDIVHQSMEGTSDAKPDDQLGEEYFSSEHKPDQDNVDAPNGSKLEQRASYWEILKDHMLNLRLRKLATLSESQTGTLPWPASR